MGHQSDTAEPDGARTEGKPVSEPSTIAEVSFKKPAKCESDSGTEVSVHTCAYII